MLRTISDDLVVIHRCRAYLELQQARRTALKLTAAVLILLAIAIALWWLQK